MEPVRSEDISAEVITKWVSVNKSLPPRAITVFVAITPRGGGDNYVYDVGFINSTGHWTLSGHPFSFGKLVKHWQYIQRP